MKVINIQDFSGGLNAWDNQRLIADNQCASGSVNVWAPQGALTKMPGATELLTTSATSSAGLVWIYGDNVTNTAYSLYQRITTATATGNAFPWAGQTNSLTPLGYTTGSVSISGASLISATGSGTSWNSHASAGDMFRVNATAASWFKVSSIEDATHLTLDGPVAAAVATGSAYTILPGLGSQIVTGADYFIANASLNGSILSVNTESLMQQYDGTGMLRISAAPKAAFLQVFKNYLFAARTNTAESRVYWSAIKTPTSWPTSNFIDIDKDRGRINGLFAFGNELLVLKSWSLYKVMGEVFDPSNPTYVVQAIQVPSGFQSNSGYSFAEYQGDVLLYARRNVYRYRHGSQFIEAVSKKFVPELSININTTDALAGFESIVPALSVNGYYLLNGMSDTTTDSTLGLIDERGAWWSARTAQTTGRGMFGGSAEAFPMAIIPPNTNAKPRVLMMAGLSRNWGSNGGEQGRVYVYDLFGPTYASNYIQNSNGANLAIQATWLSKEFNIGYGTFKHLVVYLKKQSAGTLNVDWSIDQGSYVANSVDMTVGRGNLIRRVLDINQLGSTIQLRVKQTTAGQTFEVYAIQIFYDPTPEDRKT